jgi:hypothetical protein
MERAPIVALDEGYKMLPLEQDTTGISIAFTTVHRGSQALGREMTGMARFSVAPHTERHERLVDRSNPTNVRSHGYFGPPGKAMSPEDTTGHAHGATWRQCTRRP